MRCNCHVRRMLIYVAFSVRVTGGTTKYFSFSTLAANDALQISNIFCVHYSHAYWDSRVISVMV